METEKVLRHVEAAVDEDVPLQGARIVDDEHLRFGHAFFGEQSAEVGAFRFVRRRNQLEKTETTKKKKKHADI